MPIRTIISIFILLTGTKIGLSQIDSATADSIVRALLIDYDSAGYYYIKPNTLKSGELFTLYKSFWVDDTYNDLKLESVEVDNSVGTKHLTYKQYFATIPVEGAFIKEHVDQNGFVKWVNGRVVYDLDIPVEGVDETQAIQNVINELNGYSFYWDDTDLEQDIKDETGDPDATHFPTPEICFARLPDEDNTQAFDKSQYELCWKFRIQATTPFIDNYYWVSALDGEIIKFRESWQENGPAPTFFYGYQTVDSRWAGSLIKYILDADDGYRNIHTKKNKWTLWSTRPNYKDSDDIWGTNDIAGSSAHWAVMSAWDMFENTSYMDIKSTDGQEREIRVVANNSTATTASYTYKPNSEHQYITFNTTLNEEDEIVTYATLDIAGHEFGHGFNRFLGDLEEEGESYALVEGFCDIYGFLTERYTMDPSATCTLTTDDCDWLMGEDIDLARNIEQPNITDNPHTYGGTFYDETSNDQHHLNSTILSHWFYLLSVGGAGTNDNSYSFNVTGIGVDDAAEIAYQTHLTQIAGNDGFDQARAGSIAESIDIFGQNSTEHIQTVCAWAAVGVGSVEQCMLLSNKEPKIDGQNSLILYPNPNQGQFQILLPALTKWSITIQTIDGNLVDQFTESKSKTVHLDLTDQSSGVYIINATSSNERLSARYIKTN
ncbi:MAG: M4 family metallopeptidase [Salibacteraceae bacterium]